MAKNILLLGGHGKISLLMTPLLTARSWNVTSVIRNPDQKATVLDAGKKGPGKIDVLIESLGDVKSTADAKRILDLVKPDWVVWSAGAGGEGGAAQTYAIDRDACTHFIKASVDTPSVTKFLLVSALLERRGKAEWWDEKSWSEVQHVSEKVMPDYFKAKLAADEALTVLGEERRSSESASGFKYIILRPGTLSDDEATGKVALGKTQARGKVPRADVAAVAAKLLDSEAWGWIDLLEGSEDVDGAVARVVNEGVNTIDGEDVEVMKRHLL